jgi:hypothetical protein
VSTTHGALLQLMADLLHTRPHDRRGGEGPEDPKTPDEHEPMQLEPDISAELDRILAATRTTRARSSA